MQINTPIPFNNNERVVSVKKCLHARFCFTDYELPKILKCHVCIAHLKQILPIHVYFTDSDNGRYLYPFRFFYRFRRCETEPARSQSPIRH